MQINKAVKTKGNKCIQVSLALRGVEFLVNILPGYFTRNTYAQPVLVRLFWRC